MMLKCDCRVWCCGDYMAATLVENPTPSALPAIVSDPAFADRRDWSLNIYRARLAPAPTGRIAPTPAPNRAAIAPRPAKAASPSRASLLLRDTGLCCHRCSKDFAAYASATAGSTPAAAILPTTPLHRRKSGGADRALPVG